jgi:nucleoside-diphosphate-sugar epimerase
MDRMRDLVIITGSSGFLGSALCVAMSQTHEVAGIDCRPPNQALRQAAPKVRWYTIDIRDQAKIEAAFGHLASQGFYIAYVIHLAVYYHYGAEWQRGYEETNIEGTLNLIEACQKFKVGRFVFAASIASLAPPNQVRY